MEYNINKLGKQPMKMMKRNNEKKDKIIPQMKPMKQISFLMK